MKDEDFLAAGISPAEQFNPAWVRFDQDNFVEPEFQVGIHFLSLVGPHMDHARGLDKFPEDREKMPNGGLVVIGNNFSQHSTSFSGSVVGVYFLYDNRPPFNLGEDFADIKAD